MPPHDPPVGDAQGAGGVDILEVAGAQELGADDADQAHPGEQQQDAEQHPEVGGNHRGDDQQQVERGHRGPDFDQALGDEIDPAAEIALHGAGHHADDGREDGQHEAEEDGNAEAVNQPRQHIASCAIRAQPMVVARYAEWVFGAQGIALADLLAGQQPTWWIGAGKGDEAVHGIVVVADRRPEHPAVGLDLVDIHLVAEIGDAQKSAEFGFGIVDKGGGQQLALVHHEDWPVIGDEFSAQRQHEKEQEDPEAPPAALVGAKIGEAPLIERREARWPEAFGCPAHTSRLSKSRRGSTHI